MSKVSNISASAVNHKEFEYHHEPYQIFCFNRNKEIKENISVGEENVGVVPKILEEVVKPAITNTKVITCGPPIMIKYTLQSLLKLGFADRDIITTLEMRMQCGLGKCGRCNIGSTYVCKDGPVFTYEQMKVMPDEF